MVKQIGPCLNGAQALIMQGNLHAKAAMQPVGKFTRSFGQWLLGAIHIQR